jgi:hypothetical protein
MKIFDERGKQVGEIEKPEPVEQDGVWYEAVEYRAPKEGDNYISYTGMVVTAIFDDYPKSHWIMRPIPTPTSEQLKAIGMKLRDDSPVECKNDEIIWGGLSACRLDPHGSNAIHLGTYRWHLVKDESAPVKSCGTCGDTTCCNNYKEPLVHYIDPKLCAQCWMPTGLSGFNQNSTTRRTESRR